VNVSSLGRAWPEPLAKEALRLAGQKLSREVEGSEEKRKELF